MNCIKFETRPLKIADLQILLVLKQLTIANNCFLITFQWMPDIPLKRGIQSLDDFRLICLISFSGKWGKKWKVKKTTNVT